MTFAGIPQRAAVAAGICVLLALTTAGCAREPSIPPFERAQVPSDTLPANFGADSSVDLDTMRLLAEYEGHLYYIAQDTIPGSPAVCVYIVDTSTPDSTASTCSPLPVWMGMGDVEVRVVFAGDPTPAGMVRVAPNLLVNASPGGGTWVESG
ncbi:MAG: hypothetical protein JWQ43_101 [Glaciihabitans sp.]|nr:hypothetical protein [Glaciihabitans sp.]